MMLICIYPQFSPFSNGRMDSMAIECRQALQSSKSKAKRTSDDFVALGESIAASHKADLGSSTVVHDVREPLSIRFLVDAYDSRG